MSDTPRPRQPGSGPAPTIDLSGKRKPNAPRPMPRPAAPQTARPMTPAPPLLPTPWAAPVERIPTFDERTRRMPEPEVRRAPDLAPAEIVVRRPTAPEAGQSDRDRDRDRQRRPLTPEVAAPVAQKRLASLLGSRRDIRRALIVSEVLGPPVSMRREAGRGE